IVAILPEKKMKISIKSGDEHWVILFNKEGMEFRKEMNPASKMMIEGVPERVNSLLRGEDRLSSYVRRKELSFAGPFRIMLLAEAILWLCREYEGQIENAG
ncbi:MAG TPA: hypothetical protein VEY51_14125, partial [Chondromyces sp.]|nr:hypothetical protein [Chondromyces sp.]